MRKKLNRDRTLITITDYGAGSKITSKMTRSIRSIAKGGISISKYSKLFQELIRYFGCKQLVELGTSLGINTVYLAHSRPDVKVFTFEGCSSLIDIASQIFSDLACTNVEMIKGDITETLPVYLNNTPEIDFVFMDASHTYPAIMRYFAQIMPKLSDKAVVIVDDIYWSKDMTKAWMDILQAIPGIASIDIYRCGILIFDKSFQANGLKLAF
jgi:predicted O-methyltransferase YrrM